MKKRKERSVKRRRELLCLSVTKENDIYLCGFVGGGNSLPLELTTRSDFENMIGIVKS